MLALLLARPPALLRATDPLALWLAVQLQSHPVVLVRRVYVAHHIDSPRTRIVFSVASRVVTLIDCTSKCSYGYRKIRPREKSQWHAAGVLHWQLIFDVSEVARTTGLGQW